MITIRELSELEIFDVDAYFGALIDIMNVDGDAASKEGSFLRRQAESLGYNLAETVDFPPSFTAASLKDTSPVLRRIVIRDCIRMARVDNLYDDSEQKRIRELAISLDVPVEDISAIEFWLDDYEALKIQEEKIFLES